MKEIVFLLAIALIGAVSSNDNFVEFVKQNYKSKVNDLLVAQIQKELTASYIYQAYASYFQRADVSLPGIQKFFSDASLEERGHAQMLIDYINKRGGYVQFDEIDLKGSCIEVSKSNAVLDNDSGNSLCICGFVATKQFAPDCGPRDTWQEGLMAFEDALSIERYVNDELLNIHKEADKLNDAHLTHLLEHEFLEEQVSSINQLGHFVTRLRSFTKAGSNYKLGEYMFDQNLK